MNGPIKFENFNMDNTKIPDGLFISEGTISFSGTFIPEQEISLGDFLNIRYYPDGDSSTYFDIVVDRVVSIEADELSLISKNVKYVSHNEAEMRKLGRGRIF